MDIIVVLRTLLLLLNACIVPTNGQRCGSLYGIGESVYGQPSVLECDILNIKEVNNVTWFMPDNRIAAILRWRNGQEDCTIYFQDMSCSWEIREKKNVLTLLNTSLDYEGLWACRFNVVGCSSSEGRDTHFLRVKVLPLEQSVHVEGLYNGFVDRDLKYTINCTVDVIKPEGSVYWRIGEDTPIQAPPNSKQNPDGKTFRMEGLLDVNFFGRTSAVQVDCLVTEKNTPDDILLIKPYKSVEIWWKATTEVSKNTTTDPVERRPYSLQCDITGGNPGKGNSYQWKRDGIIVVRQTGPQLDIPMLDQDEHSKTFTCAADNGAGMGDHGTGLALQVLSLATVETSLPDTAVEGSDVTLGCSLTGRSVADSDILDVHWKKDGADIRRDSTSGGHRVTPSITIWDIRRSDEGDYVCVVTFGKREEQSGSEKLEVWYAPINKEGDYIIRSAGLDKSVNLPCYVDANPAPTAYAWWKNGTDLHSKAHNIIQLAHVIEEDFGKYTCSVTNAISTKSFVVDLVRYSVPDRPSQFESMPNTSLSIFLSWLPEHNGGLTQTFELDSRITTNIDKYVTIMKGIPDPSVGSGDRIPVSLVVDNLDNQQLEPATSYDFRVRGENSHPLTTGPYAFTRGSTKAKPVVETYLDSFAYDHETTRVAFVWEVVAGNPSKLDLLFRLVPISRQAHTDWGVMLGDIDPDVGSYTGVTNVTLSPYYPYEFDLMAYEGSYKTHPPANSPKPTVQPPLDGVMIIDEMVIGTLLGGMVIGALVTVGLIFMIHHITQPAQKGEEKTHFENDGYMNVG